MLISLNSSYLYFLLNSVEHQKSNEACFISPTLKITFQLGCKRPKIIHKIYLQDMTIIVRNKVFLCGVQCQNYGTHGFKL